MPLEHERDTTTRTAHNYRTFGRLKAPLERAKAELAVVAGAGHLPNLDDPDRYSTLCRDFLTRHCARDTS